uniref:Uncharacterized protein MANES_12G008100 n=1 Tax=Rhizophora mucronata TaxID=61149 RepID=A0A2P2JDG9_RHIMU
MGICWSRCCSSSRPKPDPTTLNDRHVDEDEGNTYLVNGNISGNSWRSMVSTNLISWVSRVSGSFTSIWGNTTADEDFTNWPTAENSDLRVFTFAQLTDATSNFRPDMVVGRGGFGNVYRGWIKEKVPPKGIKKTCIAIKQLSFKSMQGYKEWLSEVNFLGRLSHPNLVKLQGYYGGDEGLFLVYEFMKKGSLYKHLFRKGSVQPISWNIRMKIAVGTARGLAFLHTLDKAIIHRDFKSENILLDEFYNARIADFGLAFGGPLIENTHVTTRVMGTYGYADPVYIVTGHLTVKSDVYGFGVVLVEMLTGLPSIDNKRPRGQKMLVDWIKPYLSSRHKLKRVMDSRLEGKYSPKQASEIAQLTIRCLRAEPQLRPSMKEVVEVLENMNPSM